MTVISLYNIFSVLPRSHYSNKNNNYFFIKVTMLINENEWIRFRSNLNKLVSVRTQSKPNPHAWWEKEQSSDPHFLLVYLYITSKNLTFTNSFFFITRTNHTCFFGLHFPFHTHDIHKEAKIYNLYSCKMIFETCMHDSLY